MRQSGWEISGSTRVFGIIADPINHVQTPQRLNALMRERGRNVVMVPMHVSANDLSAHLDALRSWRNFGGFIATVPHKTAVAQLCDRVSDRVATVGAANAVRREDDGTLTGDILDGVGFVDGLLGEGINPRGEAAYIAGAGGAASAIAFSLAEAGIERLVVFNRTPARSADLVQRIKQKFPVLDCRIGTREPTGCKLVINATSLGLQTDDPLPFEIGDVEDKAVVAEIVMDPEMTPLLVAARDLGHRIHLGKHMLTSQLEAMAAFMRMDQ